jgi:transcriptional regulator with XRE-family HTH domain
MNRFEHLRYERGLTQQQVADGAGISRGTVIRLEQSRYPKPTATVANALADFYGLPITDLMPLDPDHDRQVA